MAAMAHADPTSRGGTQTETRATRTREHDALHADALVQVRSVEEILATLDADGRLDGLPFMPEMLGYCGKTFRVGKRAHKTCDTAFSSGLRRMPDAVHLTGLRCDGSAHGGCQAACMLFWKDAWLKPPSTRGRPDGSTSEQGPREVPTPSAARFKLEDLTKASRHEPGTDGEVFSCQATELRGATTRLPWWDVRQYVTDIRSGNTGIRHLIIGLAKWVFAMKVRYPVNGGDDGISASTLNLKPGDRVRVKSRQEIEATLDAAHRNRGLSFDAEMVRYCGGEYRVLKRIDRIINERTGKMIRIAKDTIVLDSVTCQSDYHRFCPRSVYPYWREIWLSRID